MTLPALYRTPLPDLRPQDLPEGRRPVLNDLALKVIDRATNCVYYYGGVRWAKNRDLGSTTRQPTGDFWRYCVQTGVWEDLREQTLFNKVDNFPVPLSNAFRRLGAGKDLTSAFSRKDASETDVPVKGNLRALPKLANAMGHIVRLTSPPKSYLFLLGGEVLEDDTNAKMYGPEVEAYVNTGSPLFVIASINRLICVDLDTLVWRQIPLSNPQTVRARAGGSLALAGRFLCVFGGRMLKPGVRPDAPHDDDGDDGDELKRHFIPCEHVVVADLALKKWVVGDYGPNVKKVKAPILGIYPGVAVVCSDGGGNSTRVLVSKGFEFSSLHVFHTVWSFSIPNFVLSHHPLEQPPGQMSSPEVLVKGGGGPLAAECYFLTNTHDRGYWLDVPFEHDQIFLVLWDTFTSTRAPEPEPEQPDKQNANKKSGKTKGGTKKKTTNRSRQNQGDDDMDVDADASTPELLRESASVDSAPSPAEIETDNGNENEGDASDSEADNDGSDDPDFEPVSLGTKNLHVYSLHILMPPPSASSSSSRLQSQSGSRTKDWRFRLVSLYTPDILLPGLSEKERKDFHIGFAGVSEVNKRTSLVLVGYRKGEKEAECFARLGNCVGVVSLN